jgi:glycosyltransferase involved in cell wall biosynthesis
MQRSLSVVIPSFNEEETLEKLYNAITANASELQNDQLISDFEIWFVDDGSTDKSLEVLRELCARDANCHVIVFRHNFGKAAALAAGFEYANGDIIITMDADFQDDPADFRRFIEELDKGYDLVSGWKKVRNDPLEKRLPSKLFNKVTSCMSGVKLHDFNCGFKAYRRDAAKSLNIYGEFHRYLPVLAARNGFRSGEITVVNHKREFGHSKYGWERYLRGLFDSMSASFLLHYSDRPMYLFGKWSLWSFLLSAILFAVGFFVRRSTLAWIGSMFLLTWSVFFVAIGLLANLAVDYLRKNRFGRDHIREVIGK